MCYFRGPRADSLGILKIPFSAINDGPRLLWFMHEDWCNRVLTIPRKTKGLQENWNHYSDTSPQDCIARRATITVFLVVPRLGFQAQVWKGKDIFDRPVGKGALQQESHCSFSLQSSFVWRHDPFCFVFVEKAIDRIAWPQVFGSKRVIVDDSLSDNKKSHLQSIADCLFRGDKLVHMTFDPIRKKLEVMHGSFVVRQLFEFCFLDLATRVCFYAEMKYCSRNLSLGQKKKGISLVQSLQL